MLIHPQIKQTELWDLSHHFLSIVKINIRHILEKINAYQWFQINNTKTVEKQHIYL